jgi:type I restriction enzyme, S subunit
VLTQAVTGKLTEEWRKDKDFKAVFLNKEFKDTCFIESQGLPEPWSVMLVKDYLINYDNQRIPVSQKEREKRKGEFPYYGATGIIDTIDGYTHDGEFILISEDGKNLVYRNKPISFLAKGKIWVNNHAHILGVHDGFQNMYVIYCFNSMDFNPYVTGIDQVKLSQQNLNLIPLPIPPKEEQVEIVKRVEALFAKADAIEEQYLSLKEKIEKLPQALLAKALRGELVPQDENDEPASVLLERINQYKQSINKPKHTVNTRNAYAEKGGMIGLGE